MAETQEEAESNCMQQGARLFTPRSTRAKKFFEEFEEMHVGKDSMFQYAKDVSRQAIGMMYPLESPGTEVSLIYR